MSLEKEVRQLLYELESLPKNRIAPRVVDPKKPIAATIVSSDNFNAYSVVEIVIARLRAVLNKKYCTKCGDEINEEYVEGSKGKIYCTNCTVDGLAKAMPIGGPED